MLESNRVNLFHAFTKNQMEGDGFGEMRFLDKLERKFGRLGIPNLTYYIIATYIAGFLLSTFSPQAISLISLNVALILKGQVWRLISWVLIPPSTGMLFIVAIFFFYMPIGTALERTLGDFKYTLYIFSGILFTILGAFVLYFLTGGALDLITIGGISLSARLFSTYYISLSVFLAYAAMYPDQMILLMFVFPLKVKWMAFVYLGFLAYDMITYIRMGVWYQIVPIVASLLNFFIFFLLTRDYRRINPAEIRRKREFRKQMEYRGRNSGQYGSGSSANRTVTKHRCAVCGRTELDDPNLEFRFCTRCNGNYEYCQDHLFTHQHVQ